MSPVFSSTSLEAYGTKITSYWLPGQEAAGRAALGYAVSALRIYSDYYGGYPPREMSVAPAPINFRGMEYPQVNLIGVELYTRFQRDMEILVAHEVAHQWWYEIVHNDPVHMPWLDEAIAEYSVKLYYEKLYGPSAAALLERRRWQTPLELLRMRELDSQLNRPVDTFENGQQYEAVVYGKGALLYSELRAALGDRRFRQFLRDYLMTYRYQIVNTDSWRTEIEKFQLPVLDQLFDEWVGEPRPVAPTPTPEPTDDNS
jgi:aminopeptidase N